MITFSIVVSFGVLYFTLPDYYFYIKNKSLTENTDLLAEKISALAGDDEIRKEITDFSVQNNASVVSYTEDGGLIVGLSTPFSALYQRGVDVLWASDTEHVTIRTEGAASVYSDVIYVEEVRSMVSPETAITQSDIGRMPFAGGRVPRASIVSIEKKPDHEFIERLVVTGTLQPIDEAQTVIISLAPYLLLANIIFALAAAFIYSHRMTKPIVALSAAAAEMRNMTPGIVSGIKRGDELGELSENLDLLYLSLCDNIESLRGEMEKVSVLEKSKTDFMRAASHELKTPLAGLNGIIEGMIDNVGKYKDRDRYLHECKKLTDSLARLTGEILRACKLDTPDNILQRGEAKLSSIVESILNDQRMFVEEKKMIVSFEPNEAVVITDPNVLRNALSNIISNAVKYTDDGGIILIETEEKSDGYVLSVENKCENIPDSVLPKLFEPFYTQNYSRNRIRSGTGLGLYIVKRNLEMLNLHYGLENTKLGLRFSIYFENNNNREE